MPPGASDEAEETTVLVVDDEEKLADMYTLWLRAEYEVRTVYAGDGVMEELDDEVDVVLLDRRMPGYSGDEVLEMISRSEYDPSVVMITAVDPDFDILEMPFDDYLCKPVQADDLKTAIRQQETAHQHSDELQEYLQLRAKQRLLEIEKRQHELEDNEEYTELQREIDERYDRLSRTIEDFEAVLETFKSINREPGRADANG